MKKVLLHIAAAVSLAIMGFTVMEYRYAIRHPFQYGWPSHWVASSVLSCIYLGLLLVYFFAIRGLKKLKAKGCSCTLVNARFVKPFDTEMIDRLCEKHKLIVTMEENVLRGGMGMCITKYIHDKYPGIRVIQIALPDAYVEHGNVTALREMLGIDSDSVIRRIFSEYLDKEQQNS